MPKYENYSAGHDIPGAKSTVGCRESGRTTESEYGGHRPKRLLNTGGVVQICLGGKIHLKNFTVCEENLMGYS